MKKLFLSICLVATIGCGGDKHERSLQIPQVNDDRLKVVSARSLSTEFNGRATLYVIVDSKTNKEFILFRDTQNYNSCSLTQILDR